MSLESLVSTYGYAAILVGTLLEGETVLLLGGILAHQGYLDLSWVMAAAISGTFCADQSCYFLGRARGAAILEARPVWKAKSAVALARLRRHRILVSFGFRFLYGLRTVIPVVIGTSGIRPRQFVTWNVLGIVVWATGVGLLGYVLGGALGRVAGDLRRYELLVLAGVVALAMLVWGRPRIRRRGVGAKLDATVDE